MHENDSKEPWCSADLFFLGNTLKRGMTPEDVAGFLGRAVSEVIAKANELRIPVAERSDAPIASHKSWPYSKRSAPAETGFPFKEPAYALPT